MSTQLPASGSNAAVLPKALGGVSPAPGGPALRNPAPVIKGKAAAAGAAAYPNFVYNGGPVIGCPQVYSSFWGALWSDAAHQAHASRLNQFLTDLLHSGFMNVLTQYGVGQGTGQCGAFVSSSYLSNVPNTLTDSQIQQIIQSAITSGALPEPTNPSQIALIIYLDENTGVDDTGQSLVLCEPSNDTAFGYHSFFTTTAGNPFYYAIIPALSDACLQESCPGNDAGCSLHLSETQEQRQTQVTSHEFAEMTTDPQLNAWYDPQNGENGDICNGQSALITVGQNTWTVQATYSKIDDSQSGGLTYCRATAPSPLPPISPGPGAKQAPAGKGQAMAAFDRVLPLPPVHFNPETLEVKFEDWHLHHYVRKVFHPFRHDHFIQNFPAFLRKVADALERGK